MADFSSLQSEAGFAQQTVAPQQVIQPMVDTSGLEAVKAVGSLALDSYRLYKQEEKNEAQVSKQKELGTITRDLNGLLQGAEQGVYTNSEARRLAKQRLREAVAENPSMAEDYTKSFKSLFGSKEGEGLSGVSGTEALASHLESQAAKEGVSLRNSQGDVDEEATEAYAASLTERTQLQQRLNKLSTQESIDVAELRATAGGMTSAHLDGMELAVKNILDKNADPQAAAGELALFLDQSISDFKLQLAPLPKAERDAYSESLENYKKLMLGQVNGTIGAEQATAQVASTKALMEAKRWKADPELEYILEKFSSNYAVGSQVGPILLEKMKGSKLTLGNSTDPMANNSVVHELRNLTQSYPNPASIADGKNTKTTKAILNDAVLYKDPKMGLNTINGIVDSIILDAHTKDEKAFLAVMGVTASKEFKNYVDFNREGLDSRKVNMAQERLTIAMQNKVLPSLEKMASKPYTTYAEGGNSVQTPLSELTKLQKVGESYRLVPDHDKINKAMEGNKYQTFSSKDTTAGTFGFSAASVTPFRRDKVLEDIANLNSKVMPVVNQHLMAQANLMSVTAGTHVSVDSAVEGGGLPEVQHFLEIFGQTPEQDSPVAPESPQEAKKEEKAPEVQAAPKNTGERFVGREAVEAVKAREGDLTPEMERVIEEEGFVDGVYLDDKGNETSGVGQTGKYKGMTFKESFLAHREIAEKLVKDFDSLSPDLRKELIQLTYRSDLQISKNTVALINEGKYSEAADELLRHDEYLERKKKKDDGVTRRLEAAYHALKREGN